MAPPTATATVTARVKAAEARFGTPDAADYAALNRTLPDILASVSAEPQSLVDTVQRYIRAAAAAHRKTNCLTAFPWQQAIQRAEQLQPELQALPLRGLVFSVKDCIQYVTVLVDGFDTTLGCSSRVGKPEKRTAWIVDQLEKRGAIMIARTACPQAMTAGVTHSPLWGRVSSPLGDEYQVGGSSGGEAALVALGGSAIGIGTDMGGSIRQPAALSELFGLKLRSDTCPFTQPDDYYTGTPHVQVPATGCGFLARHAESVQVVCDALAIHMPAPQQSIAPHLVAVCTQEASPEVEHLILRAAQALTAHSPVVVDEMLGDPNRWAEAWINGVRIHGFTHGRSMVADEPIIPESMLNMDPAPLADAERQATLELQRSLVTELTKRLSESRADLILCPGYTYGGPTRRDAFAHAASGLAEIWLQAGNILDWTAVNVPLHVAPAVREQARKQDDAWSRRHQGEYVARVWPEIVDAGWLPESLDRSPWNNTGSRLPTISVQVIARPGTERKLHQFVQELRTVAAKLEPGAA